ncbi:flagellar basal body-associated protein FliL [Aliidiomarina minuta]|uniref:Flagellar protein FliL n=1 Tax=Aliidiomarina minuta TaxID=880057 RepID=A0A432W4S9_9GAMM|nr:flagellar basal body-associated protein FliL [Aliidiomarina minuta]RUO24511.1 flagellar basal body-associated protein FliL [Aliidiomarina minuta]
MAAEPEEQQAVVGIKQNKKKILIIAGAVTAAVIVIIVGLWLLTGGEEVDTGSASGEEQERRVDDAGAAYYVAMPRDFIFNVPGAQRDRVVQISVQLMVRGSRNEELAQRNIPLIEGSLLQIFSTGTAERLSTPEGKREIRVQAREATQEAMREATNGSAVVEEVLFTGFVMQ